MTTTGSSSSIVFTGTDFDFSADYSAIATFAGIQADSVVVNSATQATATFNLGAPLVIGDTKAVLSFLKDDSTTEQVFAESATAMENDISITASTSSL